MTKILVVADEVDEGLTHPRLGEIAPDLVLSCGDLPFDYLEGIVDICNAPLLYVPGNHDPALRGWGRGMHVLPPYIDSSTREPTGPRGGVNIDGRIVEIRELTIAGLGGSARYAPGPNRYTEGQMRLRALRLEIAARLSFGARIDLFVAHSPPRGIGDDESDPAHRGFRSFHRIASALSPRLFLHGHVHPYGRPTRDVVLDGTSVINAIPHRVLEVEAPVSTGSHR